jgi:hypothetical protein
MSPTPDGEQIRVALNAIRSYAKSWTAAASDLGKPKSTAAGLDLSAADVSMWGTDYGIDRLYNDLRTKLEDVLGQASESFTTIGTKLIDAANTYEQEEAQNLHRFNNAY